LKLYQAKPSDTEAAAEKDGYPESIEGEPEGAASFADPECAELEGINAGK
jgi:hypothetical protein